MKTIWKYCLKPTAPTGSEMFMPADAEILSVAGIDGEIYLWALVDPKADQEQEARKIAVFGTGFEVPEQKMQFIGTGFHGSVCVPCV